MVYVTSYNYRQSSSRMSGMSTQIAEFFLFSIAFSIARLTLQLMLPTTLQP